MSETKVVLWDFVGGLVDRRAEGFSIREKAASRITQSKVQNGILAALPATFGCAELRLFLRDNLLEAFFDQGLLINSSAFSLPPLDRRVFAAVAALAGEKPADILYITANPAAAESARTAGLHVEDSSAASLLGETAPAAELLSAIDPDTGPTYVLEGRLVTMDAAGTVIDNGRLVISKGNIEAVLESGDTLPAAFAGAPVINTGATIFPGLIDLHNHFAYNIHQLWNVPDTFSNRTKWQRDKSYRRGVNQATGLMAKIPVYAKAMARFVEVKAVMGGTTSGQGIRMKSHGFAGLAKGIMRNIEITGDARLPEVATLVPDLNANNLEQVERFRRSLDSNKSFLYHMSEGIDGSARQRFLDLKNNGLIKASLVGIHSLGLHSSDFDDLASAGGKVVWSPFSNLLLYGKTLDLGELLSRSIPFSLGSDWSPTGGKNLLEELKVARWVSTQQGGLLSDEQLVRMITSIPATIIGWESALGSLHNGALADLIAIRGTAGNPYRQLVDAVERDVALVVIHGRPRYGDTPLMTRLVAPATLEAVSIDGEAKSLFLESANSPINGLSLSTALEQLEEAMGDLKEVQRKVVEGSPGLLIDANTEFELELDMEAGTDEDRSADAMLLADDDEVEPKMALDGLFVNETHLDLVDAEMNLPDGLKQELRNAYQ